MAEHGRAANRTVSEGRRTAVPRITRRLRLGAAGAALATLAVTTVLVSSLSPPATAATMARGPVLSQFENPLRSVSRDGGLAVALPNGKELWIFGDSVVFNLQSTGQYAPTAFVSGTTAAEGSYVRGQITTGLLEVPSPGRPLTWSANAPPSQFIPAPNDVYLPDGSGNLCTFAPGRYPARWASGVAIIPNTHDLLVTYADMCVTGNWHFTDEGWGFMEYNWQTNALDVPPHDVVVPARSGAAMPPTRQLGTPVIVNGQVSLFSFVCTSLFVGCGAGQVYATTLPDTVASLENPASYVVKAVPTDGSAAWTPTGIWVASYPDATFRMIESTAITGAYSVFTAPTAAGPWHLEESGTVPNCAGLTNGFCYSLIGHPDLTTPSQLVISYFDPGSGPPGPNGAPIGHLIGAGMPYRYSPCTAYSSTATGTHWVCGAIRDKYLALGGQYGSLGYPTTDETPTSGTVGRYSNFTGGAIYWSPSTGAWSTHGAILGRYLALGGPSSFLGYPVTDVKATPDGVGRFNHFSNSGSIYWTPTTGAWSIHGAIRGKWASMGWERSCLGYPVSDEFGTTNGRQSNFQRGWIKFSWLTGTATPSC